MSSAMPLHKQQLPFPYLVVGQIPYLGLVTNGVEAFSQVAEHGLDGKGGKLLVENRDILLL